MIPKKIRGGKSIKVAKKEKIPVEKGWQLEDGNNYSYDDPILQDWINKGGNYGILCGNGLVVIDCDDKIAEELVNDNLPETFTVLTGTHRLHFYYHCHDAKNLKIFKDETRKTLADIQYEGKFVVAPNSIHPNGNPYEVYNGI